MSRGSVVSLRLFRFSQPGAGSGPIAHHFECVSWLCGIVGLHFRLSMSKVGEMQSLSSGSCWGQTTCMRSHAGLPSC